MSTSAACAATDRFLWIDADAAVLRQADGGLVLGDRVHRGGDERDVERELAGERRAQIDVARKDVARAGHEEDVVERQPLADARLGHVGFTRPRDGRAV